MFLFWIRDQLWSFPIVTFLIVLGGYFSHSTHFFQFHPIKLLQETLFTLFQKGKPKKELISAVSTALGGTVGVGSIIGVSLGIQVGGAGSIFWMWISGLTGMALKYAEVYLAVKHRKKLPDGSFAGGAPYALTECGYPLAGKIFAIFTILASFGVGNLTQIAALGECSDALRIPKPCFGLLCAVVIAFIIFGGQRRISSVSCFLVPPTALFYILSVSWILMLNFRNLPNAFFAIISGAFGIKPILGGISGSLIANSMREGFARGIFSNEAGVGSSALAHAASGESNPQIQAKWGAFEILIDTFLISTLTAFALLSSGQNSVPKMFENHFGKVGVAVFLLLTAVFAFSSILSWCFYGDVCLTFLNIPHGKSIYRICFVLTSLFGTIASPTIFWCLADIMNALMMFPNLFLLFLRRKEIQ